MSNILESICDEADRLERRVSKLEQQLAERDAEIAELATGLNKTLKCIRYMQGIAERGLGRKMLDEQAPDLFLLAYVKSIEQECYQLRNQVTLLRDAVKKFLSDNDPEGFGCACSPNHICSPCSEAKRQRPLYEALAVEVINQ